MVKLYQDYYPDIANHHIVCNLRGAFSESLVPFGTLGRAGAGASGFRLIFDGGDDVTEILAERTSTSAAAGIIRDQTLSITANQYKGYWVEFTSGTHVGKQYAIASHTADGVFTLLRANITPTTGDKFRIVAPATTISSGSWQFIPAGYSQIVLQRFRVTGSASLLTISTGSTFQISGVVYESSAQWTVVARNFVAAGNPLDPTNPAASLTTKELGLSHLGSGALSIENTNSAQFVSVISKAAININGCDSVTGSRGSHYGGDVTVRRSRATSFLTTAGYPTTTFDVGGLILEAGTDFTMGAGIALNNNPSHAIEVESSKFKFDGVVVGSGNVGAGLYAKKFANIEITNGSTPTLTGTVGDFTFNGTTQSGLWSTVDSGVTFSDPVNFNLIKEV